MVFGKKDTVNNTVEKSKTVARSQIEGSGIYSCTAAGPCAENHFSTTDKAEWEKHLKEVKHYSQGAAPCAVCGNEVDMNVVVTRAGNKPLHPECRGEPEEL